MADDRPLLNPVLSLRLEPQPETSPGGGKSRRSVRFDRLPQQQAVLSKAALGLYESRERLAVYGGRTHLFAEMFVEDSLAPSYTPTDLFGPVHGCQIVAPLKRGYLVEADVTSLPGLARAIQSPTNIPEQCDISRVHSLSSFGAQERLRQHSLDELWEAAPEREKGRQFVLWLAPYRNAEAQADLMRELVSLSVDQIILPTFTAVRLLGEETEASAEIVATPSQSSIARAMRSYRNTGVGRATITVPSKEALSALIASGVSHRIDPVRPITVAAPGEGAEPAPPARIHNAPIVGVIDGGLHAHSYQSAQAWRVTPLVSTAQADTKHGNAVSSLIVQGHAWNRNRLLPQIDCRIGTVQAVPHKNANRIFEERELVDYLAAAMRAHPETFVWNISANQDASAFNDDEVSVLGHELNQLARAAKILPVISVGNGKSEQTWPNPPADCDAAVVVGGRNADKEGRPAKPCAACLPGPGPDGMLKPDVSWFSTLRMIGGVVATGSSYATAIMSSLAAHTHANLRDPSPDIVKALLISNSELDAHDARLGWGTPYHGTFPWACKPGTVTLAWREYLQPGANYYWNDIPIPPQLIRKGKLYGRARLTAILNPLVSPFGGTNYFASRLQTSLQYHNGKDWTALLGSMRESTLTEHEARDDLKKWNPVRRHSCDFTKRSGRKFSGETFRLFARVYTRDLYQFGWTHHSSAGPQEVAFVLSLETADGTDGIYGSMVQQLGSFVESAVINQDIEISS